MWLIRFLCFFLLLIPRYLFAEVHVKDGGTWKAASEIHVKDAGTWKAVQSVHVNDSGVWKMVFTITPDTGELKISFEWEVIPKDIKVTPNYWAASTAYVVGNRIKMVDFYSIYAEITTAGTSSAGGPTWPVTELLTSGGPVINNGNGTVNIPCMNTSAILSGNIVTIAGTANYNGTYTLGTQATAGQITITHAYTAETIFSGMVVKAYSLTVADGSAVWTLKEYASGITGYKIYLNDTLLCSATGKTASTLNCNPVPALGQPANFSATFIHAADGESLPSTKSWANGYPAWQATTAYALDDGVQAGENWAYSAPMKVITAGTSGGTEPTWPVKKYISRSINLTGTTSESAGSAVDNGDGTVGLPCPGHGFIAGDVVSVSETVNYNGTYVVGTQANSDILTITHAYTAETFAFNDRGRIPTVLNFGRDVAGAAINNGDGTVTIPSPAHGFVSGNSVYFAGTVNYNGLYTLGTQANPDAITITKTYVAETFSTGNERVFKSDESYFKNIPPPGTYITSTAHAITYSAGMTLSGTTNYNGLTTGWVINANTLFIAKPYVAETLTATAAVYKAPVVDNGSGKINLPCPGHGFVAGDEVTITGAYPWGGTYTLGTQSNPNAITINVNGTYIVKEVSGSIVKKKVTDGTVVWKLTYE